MAPIFKSSRDHSDAPKASERRRDYGLLCIGLLLVVVVVPAIELFVVPNIKIEWIKKAVEGLSFGTEHLGVALVVLMAVKILIEEASQRQFLNVVNTEVKAQIETSIKAISKDSLEPLQKTIDKVDEALGYTIRRREIIDDQSLAELTDKVLNARFLRSDYCLKLTLEPVSSVGNLPADLVSVRVRTVYRVQNLTKVPAIYPVKAWVETINQPPGVADSQKARFLSLSCGPEAWQNKKSRPVIDLKELIDDKKITEVNGGLWLHYDTEDPIPAGGMYYVDIEAVQLNRKQDLFVWVMGGLTRKLKVSVQFAGGFHPGAFQVDARELHHMEHKDFLDSRPTGKNEWTIDQVLLPYQGVQIWWTPTQSPEAATG